MSASSFTMTVSSRGETPSKDSQPRSSGRLMRELLTFSADGNSKVTANRHLKVPGYVRRLLVLAITFAALDPAVGFLPSPPLPPTRPPLPPTRPPMTHYVEPGVDTLQQAHDDLSVIDGDTLILRDGEYVSTATSNTSETVTVDPVQGPKTRTPVVLEVTKSLTIRAANSRRAFINGQNVKTCIRIGLEGSNPDEDNIFLQSFSGGLLASNIVLEGLVITNGTLVDIMEEYLPGAAGLTASGNDLMIRDCEFSWHTGFATGAVYLNWGRHYFHSNLFVNNAVISGAQHLETMPLASTGFAAVTQVSDSPLGSASESQNRIDPATELFNNTFVHNPSSRSMTGVAIYWPLVYRCTNLGEWMRPFPNLYTEMSITGCPTRCDAGRYGSSYKLTTAECTAPW